MKSQKYLQRKTTRENATKLAKSGKTLPNERKQITIIKHAQKTG